MSQALNRSGAFASAVTREGCGNRLNPERPGTSPRRHLLLYTILGLAVFLWGTSYKLSLYHAHPQSASESRIAKFWLGPRHTHRVQFSKPSRRILDTLQLHARPESSHWQSVAGLVPSQHVAPTVDTCVILASSPRAPPLAG